jgi:hypothetical protein
MATRIPEDQIPNDEPWSDQEFLEWAYYERGSSLQLIAYKLGVLTSHVTVYLERYGMTRKLRHELTLRRLQVDKVCQRTR